MESFEAANEITGNTTSYYVSLTFYLCRRHVLRFLVQAPHGYHVEMASQTPFVYGDEDTVMTCLTKVRAQN